jgi:hypothetical protein
MSSDPETRKRQIGGMLFLLMTPVLGYFFMYKPVVEGLRTGMLHYYLKGVMLPPLVLYMGVLLLFTRFKDGELKERNAAGKMKFSRRGKIFLAGVVVVIGATVAGWFVVLHALGFTGLL